MHALPVFASVAVALAMAFIGGVLARRVGLPTIVGYLLAGIAIGPFTPGFVGDSHTIQQLAELGVVFLMFGVGLHFSFGDLWRVRGIALPGALVHKAITTLAGVGLTHLWGWPLSAGVVIGLSISVASTVVLLRGLMDHSLLNTPHGQAAVGWLVMEDILSILILVLMPLAAGGAAGFDAGHLALTLLKASAFVAIMLIAGPRVIPWILERSALARSRELFVLGVLAITLGTAVAAAMLFGVSLALGAFAAGAAISRSRLSHQVGADVFSFREAFSVLFFVSIGMLVNPRFVWEHAGQVFWLTVLVVAGKAVIVLVMGLFIKHPARTILVIAVGLSQIGEFSFILGEAGVSLGLLERDQYAIVLAVALFSITLNPFMYALLPSTERVLRRLPSVWKQLESGRTIPDVDEAAMRDHVVVVGYGRVGKHLVDVLGSLGIPIVVIESDIERIAVLNEKRTPALYGDAANSEVITHAHLARARALVITAPDDVTALMIATSAKSINPNLTIVARAASDSGVRQLARAGARHVVHPEREGGLEMVHNTLLELGFPLRRVHEYVESVRRDHYDAVIDTAAEQSALHALLHAAEGLEITWMTLAPASGLAGRSLAEADIRSRTGASVVALFRGGRLIPNPKSMIVFEGGDRIAVIGEPEQVAAARALAG